MKSRQTDFIEVIVNKQDDKYIAESPHYPTCKGKGINRDHALRNLSIAIGKYVYKKTVAMLNTTFKSDNASQIVLDPKTTDPDHSHHIYHFDECILPFHKHVVLKYKPVLLPKNKTAFRKDDLQTLLEEFLMVDQPSNRHYSYKEHEGDVLFGIMLCLN